MKRLLCAFALATLAGCAASPPVPTAPVAPPVPPEQRLAAVEAAAGADDKELQVQPLRDPQVEDLRQRAEQARRNRDYAAAADALNQALLLVPDDPALLQERAEIALVQGQYERAETLARRALELGSRTGPLCRRHWVTIEQAWLARGDEINANSARAQIEGCTVPGVLRM